VEIVKFLSASYSLEKNSNSSGCGASFKDQEQSGFAQFALRLVE